MRKGGGGAGGGGDNGEEPWKVQGSSFLGAASKSDLGLRDMWLSSRGHCDKTRDYGPQRIGVRKQMANEFPDAFRGKYNLGER